MSEVDVIVLTINYDTFDRCKAALDLQGVDLHGILHVNIPRESGREPDGWTVIGDGANHSFSESVNHCLSHTTTDRVLLLSDDAYMGAGALRAMLGHDNAVVGAVLVNSDGTANHVGMRFNRNGSPVHTGRGTDPQQAGPCHPVPCVTAACMLLSREVLQTVGPLDPAYWYSHEDVDLVLRIRESGYGMPMLCTDAVAMHDEHGTNIEIPFTNNLTHFAKSWVYNGRLHRLLAEDELAEVRR